MTCSECGLTWLDGRETCDHRIFSDDAGKYREPALEPEPEAAYVPSLADFEALYSTMDKQQEQVALVDGELMRGRQVGSQFVPEDRTGFADATQNALDVMKGD